MKKKFEYKIVSGRTLYQIGDEKKSGKTYDTQKVALDYFGSQGWELCSVEEVRFHKDDDVEEIFNHKSFIFKRQIKN